MLANCANTFFLFPLVPGQKRSQIYVCIFNTSIQHQFLTKEITFLNSQHTSKNCKGYFEVKKAFKNKTYLDFVQQIELIS